MSEGGGREREGILCMYFWLLMDVYREEYMLLFFSIGVCGCVWGVGLLFVWVFWLVFLAIKLS